MSLAQSLSACFVFCTIVLLGLKPDSPATAFAVASTAALFIGVTLIERRQSTEFDLLSSRVADLKNKVDMLLLNKGFGR